MTEETKNKLDKFKSLLKVEAGIEEFTRLLNMAPGQHEIQVNPGGYQFMPISFIEAKLDALFFGQWKTSDFRHTVIVNEMAGSVLLHVKHPITGEWLTKNGAAGEMIRTRSVKNGGNGNFWEMEQKLQVTIQMDYPSLLSSCIANAAKRLGKTFGRDLNRHMKGFYAPLTGQLEVSAEAKEHLGKLETPAQLQEAWKNNPQYHGNQYAMDAFLQNHRRLHPKKQLSK